MELTWLGFFFSTWLPISLQLSPTPASMVHRSRFCLVSLPGTLLARYGVTYINRKLMFCTLGQWTCPNFRANGVYRGKGTEQCKFGSVKACKKEKELTSGWCASLKNAFASASYSFILMHLSMLCRRGGKAGHGVGIWLFSKICNQIPCPRANHSSQMQPNFPTPGCALHCCPSQGWTQERHNTNISK